MKMYWSPLIGQCSFSYVCRILLDGLVIGSSLVRGLRTYTSGRGTKTGEMGYFAIAGIGAYNGVVGYL